VNRNQKPNSGHGTQHTFHNQHPTENIHTRTKKTIKHTHYPALNAGVQWRKPKFSQTHYPALNVGAQWRSNTCKLHSLWFDSNGDRPP
jgi:hypothetical protein